MDCSFGSRARGLRRIELAEPDFPERFVMIPLTRFPGFVWMIAAGIALPNAMPQAIP